MRPCLAVTLGDPAGIGPEVILKALADPQLCHDCEVVVVGSRALLQDTYERLRKACGIPERRSLPAGESHQSPLANPARLEVLDVPLESGIEQRLMLGQGNAASGAASFAYLESAIAKTLTGQFQGIVTGPIAKSAWKAAGQNYPGQTELLAERANANRFGMLFVARSPHSGWVLRTLLATTHIPLRQVPDCLTSELLSLKLDLLVTCLRQDFGLERPSIAVSGLNPHSGEQGQLGTEERDWLSPWLEQQRRDRPGIELYGPVPPDTLWVKPGQVWYGTVDSAQACDAYLALYHDQGLIPVKLMAFDRAVNTTIGLPFVRTSPDHGTAFDIAGKGLADATSMKAAIQLAVELARQRGN